MTTAEMTTLLDTPLSYRAEVIADNSGQWVGNALRFPTREEANSYALDLAMRWLMVRESRVAVVNEPANYTFLNGQLQPVEAR